MAGFSFRHLARRAGLGRALRVVYHTPVGIAQKSLREGGPLQQRQTEHGRRAMIEAAGRLAPLSPRDGADGAEVHFLSGARFWYQTLFCAYSLQQHSPTRVTPVVHDDGTLTDADVLALRRAIPWTKVVRYPDIERRLDALLPADRFPSLRARRLVYPHLRKLTDIHLGRPGWTLVLDSDMLFFREPAFVLGWLAKPDRPCHMVDSVPSYGYSDALMASLAGAPIPPLVNVGFCGLDSSAIDWEAVERWCETLIEREGAHYFQEQALTAMLVAGQDRAVAPADEYVVLPSLEEGRRPTAVLHHYVAESKRSYFQHGWRIVASTPEGA